MIWHCKPSQMCVCSVSPTYRMEGFVRVSCIDHQSYQTNIPSCAENTMGIHFFHYICLISVISAVAAFWLVFRALLQFRVQFSSYLKLSESGVCQQSLSAAFRSAHRIQYLFTHLQRPVNWQSD